MDLLLIPLVIIQTYLLEKKNKYGWYIVLLNNAIYAYVSIADRRFGFLALSIIMTYFAIRGILEW